MISQKYKNIKTMHFKCLIFVCWFVLLQKNTVFTVHYEHNINVINKLFPTNSHLCFQGSAPLNVMTGRQRREQKAWWDGCWIWGERPGLQSVEPSGL